MEDPHAPPRCPPRHGVGALDPSEKTPTIKTRRNDSLLLGALEETLGLYAKEMGCSNPASARVGSIFRPCHPVHRLVQPSIDARSIRRVATC